jgi:uncharacterized protein YjbI with pentapeptide repeats
MLQKFKIYGCFSGRNERKVILEDTASCFDDLVREALRSNVDLSGAYLECVNLHHCSCSNAKLSGADLTGANFARSFFRDADLRGASLLASNLAWADFSHSNFLSADLRGANFAMACLNDCNFDEAHLEGANVWSVRIYVGKWTKERLWQQTMVSEDDDFE